MNSIREQIVLAVLAAVRPAAESLQATLHRSPTVAITREQCPALVIFPEADVIAERANDLGYVILLTVVGHLPLWSAAAQPQIPRVRLICRQRAF